MAKSLILLGLAGSAFAQAVTTFINPNPIALESPSVHPIERAITNEAFQPTLTDGGPVKGSPTPTTPCKVYRVLSVCSTRTHNPTYTPPTPFPSDYLWGCPPGKLCQPRNGPPNSPGCNFEVGPPGADYVCSPDECVDPPKLVEQPEWAKKINKWVVTPGYFNLDPRYFNMTFEEAFLYPGDDGSSFFPVTVHGDLPPPEPITDISYGPASTWTRTYTQPAQPIETKTIVPGEAHETSAAEYQGKRRSPAQLGKRKSSGTVPASCYDPCNDASVAGEESGKDKSKCHHDSKYEKNRRTCQKCCTEEKEDDDDRESVPGFSDVLDFCHDSIKLKRSVDAFAFPMKRRSDLFARGLKDIDSANSTTADSTASSTNTIATIASSKPSANATAKSGATEPPMSNAASSSNDFVGPKALLKACFALLTGWVMHI